MTEAHKTPFEFDPVTYLDLMRRELPAYDRLQGEVAAASAWTERDLVVVHAEIAG